VPELAAAVILSRHQLGGFPRIIPLLTRVAAPRFERRTCRRHLLVKGDLAIMEGLKNKATSLLRDFVTERRSSRRRGARYAARIPFNVSVLADGDAARPGKPARTLAGRTRDLSEADLNLIVPSIRIGGDYLTLRENRLSITLELPSGPVTLVASPTRFEQLAGEDGGYLVGARIEGMSAPDRERYADHLRTLPSTDRRRDALHLREA
jgi:hypothetical protein